MSLPEDTKSRSTTDYSLEDFPALQGLDPALIETLRRQGKTRFLAKDMVAHTPMEECRSVGLVLHGTLRMTKIFSSGKELVIRRLSSGEMFGELICFAGSNYLGWIIASEDSAIFEIPTQLLYSLFEARSFLVAFMGHLSKKSLHLNDTIELLSLKKTDQKVAYYLLSRYEEKGSSSFELDVPVTELAVQVGSSRESVSRAFSKLQSIGSIEREGKKVRILSLESLERVLTEHQRSGNGNATG